MRALKQWLATYMGYIMHVYGPAYISTVGDAGLEAVAGDAGEGRGGQKRRGMCTTHIVHKYRAQISFTNRAQIVHKSCLLTARGALHRRTR